MIPLAVKRELKLNLFDKLGEYSVALSHDGRRILIYRYRILIDAINIDSSVIDEFGFDDLSGLRTNISSLGPLATAIGL